jgi:O-antigen/teichoic acid export membrane protein
VNLPQRLSPGGRFRFLVKDTAIYGIGEALNRGLALITFPLLARHFSVAEFGTIDLLTTCTVLLVVMIVFGQDSAVVRYFYDTEDDSVRRQVIGQALSFQIILMLVALPPAWLFAATIAQWLGLPDGDGATLIRLIIIQAPFFVFVNLSQGLLKWTFRRWHFLFMSVGTAAGTLAGLAAALLFFQLDMVGVFIVYFAIRAFFGVIGLWFIRGWLAFPDDWTQLRRLMPFALPFGVICVIAAVIPVLERSLVGSILGGEALGLYAAGAKVAMLILLPINAIETSWGPFSLALHKEEDAAETYNQVLKAVCFLLFSLVLGLSGLADIVVSLLGSSRYEGAGIVTFALCFGVAVNAVSSVTGVGIVFSKRSYLKLYGYGTLLLVAAVAIPSLAWLYGITGAAWGSMLAMLSKTLVETVLAQRAHKLPWHFKGPVAMGILTLAIGIVHQLSFDRLAVAGVDLVPLAGIVLLAVLSWFVLFDGPERSRLAGLVRRKF